MSDMVERLNAALEGRYANECEPFPMTDPDAITRLHATLQSR